MWESLCANVQINYGGNQEPFDQVDQCQNQVCSSPAWAGSLMHGKDLSIPTAIGSVGGMIKKGWG